MINLYKHLDVGRYSKQSKEKLMLQESGFICCFF